MNDATAAESSYLRFAADLPNECWQSDFTHYRLTRPDGTTGDSPGDDVEILSSLDDCSSYAPINPFGGIRLPRRRAIASAA